MRVCSAALTHNKDWGGLYLSEIVLLTSYVARRKALFLVVSLSVLFYLPLLSPVDTPRHSILRMSLVVPGT